MADSTYCPRCLRTGSDLGSCGNFALGCPPALPVDPTKVIVVACGGCDIVRAIPVADIMKGSRLLSQGASACKFDVCRASVLQSVTIPGAPSLPPPGMADWVVNEPAPEEPSPDLPPLGDIIVVDDQPPVSEEPAPEPAPSIDQAAPSKGKRGKATSKAPASDE